MEYFNVKSKCNICEKDNLCQEVIVENPNKEQRLELWCKKCTDKIMEEIYAENEMLMQEVYEDILREMYM